MFVISRRFWLFSLLIPLTVAGCGGGTEFVDLKGTVTLDGEPVPYGRIDFIPDKEKGNVGGNGFAVITDGKFDTSLDVGRGSIGGPHKVRITAFDSKPTGSGNDDTPVEGPQPNPLCIGYEIEADLPTKAGEDQEFNLPAAAKGYNQADELAKQRPATDA